MTLLFFALGALDLLDAVSTTLGDPEKKHIIEWVYKQQILPVQGSEGEYYWGKCQPNLIGISENFVPETTFRLHWLRLPRWTESC